MEMNNKIFAGVVLVVVLSYVFKNTYLNIVAILAMIAYLFYDKQGGTSNG